MAWGLPWCGPAGDPSRLGGAWREGHNGAMADNQPRDDHAKQLKQTASRVKQLRGWVSSDPSRTEEMVDALNEVTALRLLSGRPSEAAPEATEAVGAADKLVASRGPVGPYTPPVDAARYFTALTHVATIQAGLHLDEAAGRTIAVAFAWKDQLTQPGLADALAARTLVWALLDRARGAMAAGNLADANAQADAALARAREAGLSGDETPVLLAALHTSADAGWMVGLGEQSIELLREAVELWEQWTAADLAQLPRMAKPHLERLAVPVFALRRDLADRLQQTGRTDEALAMREQWAHTLHKMASRRGETGRTELAMARADQVWGLVEAGRADETDTPVEDATNALQALLKTERPVGQHLATQLLVVPSLARAQLATGDLAGARRSLDAVSNRLKGNPSVETPAAARALLLQLRAELLTAAEDPGAAGVQASADQAAAALHDEVSREHFSHISQRDFLHARARGTLLVSQQPTPHWEPLSAEQALAPQGAPERDAAANLDDAEAMRRMDEIREAEARERAVAELRHAAERSQRAREAAAARAAALEDVERRAAAAAERERAEREAAQQAEQERRAAEREQAQAARRAAEEYEAQHQADELPAQDLPDASDVQPDEVTAEPELQLVAEQEAAAAAEAERAAQQAGAERGAQVQAEAERAAREHAEAQRRAAEQAERQAREEEDRERARRQAEEHRTEREADPLAPLREAAHQALSSGDKGYVVSTHEALVAALEPVAHADPHNHGRELVMALERLSEAQGWLRGRSAGRRAKQLAREWNL